MPQDTKSKMDNYNRAMDAGRPDIVNDLINRDPNPAMRQAGFRRWAVGEAERVKRDKGRKTSRDSSRMRRRK